MQENYRKTAQLTINLANLAANYRFMKERVGSQSAIAGIVKANAYGLGLGPVFRTLLKEKCPFFFVATLNEALHLRHINKKIPIAVLGGLFIDSENEYVKNDITPVLNSLDDITRWRYQAQTLDKTLPAIIHIDTAMNRLGLSQDDVRLLAEIPDKLAGIDVQWVISHYACADEKNSKLTKTQTTQFQALAKQFPKAKTSLENSSGLFRKTGFQSDMIRPGYALYGGNPTPETDNPMRPVVSLRARILQTRYCNKGETIGYGATHALKKDTMTATIGIGYADGFLRSQSNNAVMYYNDVPCPVIGRVSMDLTTIDITKLDVTPQQGDWVEILGPNQDIDQLGKSANTIGYEILTGFGDRLHRDYIE